MAFEATMNTVVKKILELLSAKEKIRFVKIFFGLLFMAFVEMAGIASIMPFMAVVANPEIVETNKWFGYIMSKGYIGSDNFLFFLGVLVLCLLVFSNLYKAFMCRVTLEFENYMYSSLAQRLLAKYLQRPYVFYLNRNTSDLGKNVLSEARAVVNGVFSPSIKALSSSLVSFFILTLLLVVEPVIALSIAAGMGGAYLILFRIIRRLLSRIGKEQVHANYMKFKIAGEALNGIKDLKILGREKVFLDQFSHYAERHARNNVTAGTVSQVPKFFLEILAFGGILVIVIYLLGTGQSPAQMVPILALYAFAGYRLMPALQQIFASFSTMRYSLPALDVLHRDFFDDEVDHRVLVEAKGQGKPVSFQRSIELRNVSFFYPGMEEPAIQEISLKLPANGTVGFVGTTGSGKTTTIDIILGLLTPTSGDLVVDDVVVDSGNLRQWQQNLGYVPQTIFLIDDTITRNIAFGVPDEEVDFEAVLSAARIANLHEFVTTDLPKGYDTIIGERGVRLSGGQRQRIGIARALYRDPSVLILDEATSALDGLTEDAVMEAIRNLSRKKTIIMIAHRLTTVQDCDVIYLIQKGRIAGEGDYAKLQDSSEWFRSVAKTGT